jgi:hypothetical protein
VTKLHLGVINSPTESVAGWPLYAAEPITFEAPILQPSNSSRNQVAR